MPLALVVIDDRSVRWILTDKNCVAISPSACAFDALLHWTSRNESDFLRQQIRRQTAQWRHIVHDPDAAAVGRKDKIVVTRVTRQYAHSNGREVVSFELRPAFSAVDRNPKPKLCAEKQQVGFYQVFLDHVRVATNTFCVL